MLGFWNLDFLIVPLWGRCFTLYLALIPLNVNIISQRRIFFFTRHFLLTASLYKSQPRQPLWRNYTRLCLCGTENSILAQLHKSFWRIDFCDFAQKHYMTQIPASKWTIHCFFHNVWSKNNANDNNHPNHFTMDRSLITLNPQSKYVENVHPLIQMFSQLVKDHNMIVIHRACRRVYCESSKHLNSTLYENKSLKFRHLNQKLR